LVKHFARHRFFSPFNMRIVSATSVPAQLLGAALMILAVLVMSACEKQDGVRPRKGGCQSTTTPTTTPNPDTTATRADSTGRVIRPVDNAELTNDVYGPGIYQRALSVLTAPEA
jgi:hypothetical protein